MLLFYRFFLKLNNQVHNDDTIIAGIISYTIDELKPNSFHNITVIIPDSIPAMMPEALTLLKNKTDIIAGAKAAPKPAQAYITNVNITLTLNKARRT